MKKKIFGTLQAAIEFEEDMERDFNGIRDKKALP
jgi:hypothetical protein